MSTKLYIKEKKKDPIQFLKTGQNFTTKTETILNVLLQSMFPNEYRHGRSSKFTTGGRYPDFVNREKNKLIALFGDYRHKDTTSQEMIDHFKQYGLDTLVIWEPELQNLKKLKQKITSFNKD